jgi:hypothetical protein
MGHACFWWNGPYSDNPHPSASIGLVWIGAKPAGRGLQAHPSPARTAAGGRRGCRRNLGAVARAPPPRTTIYREASAVNPRRRLRFRRSALGGAERWNRGQFSQSVDSWQYHAPQIYHSRASLVWFHTSADKFSSHKKIHFVYCQKRGITKFQSQHRQRFYIEIPQVCTNHANWFFKLPIYDNI